jgi:aspartyl-tRNA(Asn)/glutamyl-tRNA(Gln) amidotransferase subunit B
MSSAEEAVAYAKKLHELVQWIGICDGNMQEGNFRCDVNVSVKKIGDKELGTRREIKNLNSFKFIKQAVDYEVNWQIERLEDGGEIKQATILFDPDSGETREMRSKEEANDYRYFPDPDLLPLVISQEKINNIKSKMYELPNEMKSRLVKEFDLTNYDADGITSNIDVANYFKELLSFKVNAKLASNWILTNLFSRLNESDIDIKSSPLRANKLAELILRIEDKTISNNAAKKVFDEIWDQDKSVDEVIDQLGLKQISNENEVIDILNQVLQDNEAMVEEYKSGKDKAFNALIGQVMKASRGKANPGQVSQLLKEKLKN